MRVPESINPPTFISLLEALGPRAVADLYQYFLLFYQPLQAALNGGLEVGENMGVLFDGTFDVTAGTAKEFAHGLGRVPVFYLYYLTSGTMTPAPVIYAESADKADWTANKIKLKCNRDTSVSSLSFSALAF